MLPPSRRHAQEEAQFANDPDASKPMIKLGSLPAKLKEAILGETKCFAVPLVLDGQFIGTGTLIEFRGCRGILTAAHVVRNDFWAINCSANSKQQLNTAVSDQTQNLAIPARYLSITRTNDASPTYGPDLAFIHIPTSPFLSTIAATKSFVNICREPDKRFARALDHRGFVVVAGFPEVSSRRVTAEGNFEPVHALQGYGFFSGQEHYERKGRYDYLKIGASYSTADSPANFRGVSGGGVWTAHLIADDLASLRLSYQMYFAGVVFYETRLSKGYRRLRAHGPRSLYKVFFPRIIKQFATRQF
jgi:hypothetical protein